ncbi:MAG TPA: hypothetical protein VF384_06965 [Planctomycetota bacterium]
MKMNLYHFSFAGSALLCILPAQNVLLPDNHHLSKSQTQVFASGSTNWWGTIASATGRRFQVLYDASHFTGIGGVSGPIAITHVRFRGEDTEHNRGGQTFTGLTASLYKTSLNSAAALNTTFATNILPATSTLLGTLAVPVLTAAPSLGRAPNNFCIDLDFSNVPMLPFDPTVAAGQANFLLDVSYAAQAVGPAPELSSMMQIQDTAGTIAFVRGRGLYSASAVSPTGTGSSLPPVLGIEFNGPGGYPVLLPARTERYGAACGGATSTFYQLFSHLEYFDLKDPGQVDQLSGLKLTPDAYPGPSFYIVTGGAAPIDLANGVVGVPISVADDATVPFGPIPAFQYPGGPAAGTTAIRPSTNGYVILDPASTETASDFSPTLAELLGTPTTNLARVAPFWHDFSPNKNTTIDPTSGLYAVINGANPAEVLVTWHRVGRYNAVAEQGQEYHSMQCSLNTATGVIEFRYGAMDQIWGDTFTTANTVSGITGFTRGAIGGVPSKDPQSRDLSIERPFVTQVEGAAGHMGNTVVTTPVVQGPVYMGRAFYGQTLKWNASNVPAGSLFGVQLVDIAAARPGIQLPFLTAPNCRLSTSPGAILWETTILPPASVTGTVGFTVPLGWPGFLGFDLYAQYIVLDGLFIPGSPLITVASNAVRTTLGLQ